MAIIDDVTERPILFSAPMVRAILAGQKTVTRRPVKGGQIPKEDTSEPIGDRMRWSAIAQVDPRYGFCVFGSTEAECAKELEEFAPCPYGRRGQRLWVREAWAADAQLNDVKPRDLSQGEPIFYPADGIIRSTGCMMISQGKTRPSIHMPRWVSRILLEITAVRVERLQDISEEQAQAEGCTADDDPFWSPTYNDPDSGGRPSHRNSFEYLWGEINGADAWDANPWVWVVEFKRVIP